ncbi:MAG: TonB-dependent receptor [Polyangiaceae bacterium]|nr:TonB-dependent receptor [Polyangiaceae bacterium]
MPPARTLKLALLGALAASSTARLSHADPQKTSAKEGELNRDDREDREDREEIDVTVRGSALTSFVSKTSVHESAREAIDTAALVSELPSVHVRRLGAEGAVATLSVRGSASTQVGAVLAGIPLTSAADPSLDVGALPLWPGATFRVYRGFAPASLGTSGYLGGVLSIEAPSPALGAGGGRTEWWTAAGSFGSLKLRAGDLRTVGPVSYGAGVFASRSDGDFSFEAEDPRTGDRLLRDRQNARFVTVGAIGRGAVDLGWGSAGLLLFADARRQGLPGPALFPTSLSALETSRIVGGLDLTVRLPEARALKSAIWARREGSMFEDPLGELDPTRRGAHVESAIEALGGSIGWRGSVLPPVMAGLVVDARAERFSSQGGADATRLSGGAGLEVTWKAASFASIAASGRVDARLDRTRLAFSPEPIEASDFAPSGYVSGSFKLPGALEIAAHAGALFRPPSFFELFGDRGTLLGDASLRPERALSADLGVRGAAGDSGAEVSYELVGFATLATDLIAFVPLGLATFRARNVERASVAGLEASAELRARGLRTSVSYTLLVTENLSPEPLSQGRPLPGRPVHDLAYDASYSLGPLRVRYGLDALAGTTVDAEGTRILPARVLHSAGASVDIPFIHGLRASIEVQNLFHLRTLYVTSPLRNARVAMPVSDFLGFPLPGRTAWLSVHYVAGSR